MFERFSSAARRVIVVASEVTRERGEPVIEAAHILIATADVGEHTLMAAGLTRLVLEDALDSALDEAADGDGLDSAALAGIGVDAEAVRKATDQAFGRGALGRIGRRRQNPTNGRLPFSPNAKHALERALRFTASSRGSSITATHLLLGLLDVGDGDVAAVVQRVGQSEAALTAAALSTLRLDAAVGGAGGPTSSSVRAGLDHLSLQVADIEAAVAFYGAALAPLGVRQLMRHDDVVGFGSDRPFFWLGKATTDGPAREVHIAFTAADRRTVYAFRDAAAGVGAEVLHKPRIFREYHPSYFAAFVRDPDGNNVEAVCHVPTSA